MKARLFGRDRAAVIAIINKSSVVTTDELAAAIDAIQIQVTRDFAPEWGTTAKLVVIDEPAEAEPDAWFVFIVDNTDQDGALGYHDVTDKGIPVTKVFAKTDQKYGLNWTVTLSHEVLEMLGDPNINLLVLHDRKLYSYETADAVEDDEMGYLINGVRVSNFVFPSWFEDFWKPDQVRFDYCGAVSRPFEIAPGGYASVLDLTTGRWKDLAPDKPGKRLQSKKEKGVGRSKIRKAKPIT